MDFTKENLPYGEDIFDVIFSKSVIEHLYYPENLFEAKKILKHGGLLITMYILGNIITGYTLKTLLTEHLL